MRVVKVAAGIHWVDIPKADLRLLCGCPADAVKHLTKRGLSYPSEIDGFSYETGPNAILLSDVALQNGEFSNLAEFPVLQMLYRQGMILPGHPNNRGRKPLILGNADQLAAQLAYIHRGNYGLLSQEEIMAAGVPAVMAKDWMRMKLRFAFGRIQSSADLLELMVVDDKPTEIRENVFIRRLSLNRFEISFEAQRAIIDLNLKPGEAYEPPFSLNHHNLRREYFSVVHSGEGDGWDVNRPAMSSVLMFQGRIYLVDAGPNLQAILKALGISITEIQGIFHTHSHDDHFCGLTSLIRADRRIRYFSTLPVRAAVTKKLAALMSIDEDEFGSYFDFRDLALDEWNDVEGMHVRPSFSPHPVENIIFTFRAPSDRGIRTYAHYADIVAFSVLDRMTTEDANANGVSPEVARMVKDVYLEPADVKKIDIGGGLIHGDAQDFANDESQRIILAHTSRELSTAERKIGSGAPFGTVDVLIPASRDYILRDAHAFLTAHFPSVPQYELEMLLNRPMQDINAESIIFRQGQFCDSVVMPVTGLIEMIHAENDRHYQLPSGTIIGDRNCLEEMPIGNTYRAASMVKALIWPPELFRTFIRRNDLFDQTIAAGFMRRIFSRSWLLGENLSIPVLNRMIRAASLVSLPAGASPDCGRDSIFLIHEGEVTLTAGRLSIERLGSGDFLGEDRVMGGRKSRLKAYATSDVEGIVIPGETLRDVPIVRWKLQETLQRRKKAVPPVVKREILPARTSNITSSPDVKDL